MPHIHPASADHKAGPLFHIHPARDHSTSQCTLLVETKEMRSQSKVTMLWSWLRRTRHMTYAKARVLQHIPQAVGPLRNDVTMIAINQLLLASSENNEDR
jgi:hypothetical protein